MISYNIPAHGELCCLPSLRGPQVYPLHMWPEYMCKNSKLSKLHRDRWPWAEAGYHIEAISPFWWVHSCHSSALHAPKHTSKENFPVFDRYIWFKHDFTHDLKWCWKLRLPAKPASSSPTWSSGSLLGSHVTGGFHYDALRKNGGRGMPWGKIKWGLANH